MMKEPNKKKNTGKSPWLTFIAVIFVLTALWVAMDPDQFLGEAIKTEKVPISEITELYNENKLEKIEIKGDQLTATLKDENVQKIAFKEPLETASDLELLNPEIKTPVEILDTSAGDFIFALLRDIIPFAIVLVIIIFMMRQVQKNAGNAFSFGKSKARLFSNKGKKTTFKDVAGAEEAKNELEEIVEFLKNPKKFLTIGARIPRGVMLIGRPGTGKTLLARAVAGEARVPFFSISGSEFVEMFVGVGASRVRDLFEKAKKNAPAIIFIDEIDAVGRQRGGSGYSGGHDEREQTLNQILSEMDGFEDNTNVIVVAATNRPDVLDKALLRPGRFDRRVVIDMPDIKDRTAILKVHTKGKKMSPKIDFDKIARMTSGFAGADLANILNEAAIQAAKNNKKTIGQKDLEFATEKVIIGPERKSQIISKDRKLKTAYHEAGHAIIGHLLPNADPIHKVTIIPRGMSLGSTWSLPDEDQFGYSKSKFLDEVCTLLGGFSAEKLMLSETGTGVSNDLKRATDIARGMVTRFGMSELGPIVFDDDDGGSFLGIDITRQRQISEKYSETIDKEINKIISEQLKRADKLLKDNKKILEKIAQTLLKKETLDQKEFEAFFK